MKKQVYYERLLILKSRSGCISFECEALARNEFACASLSSYF